MTQLLAEHRCLSEVLYYEARGEGDQGEKAVAEVVFHRMNTGNYGHSICAVVYEGSGHPGCQFSFTCNGDLHRRKEVSAWDQAEQLAAQILTGQAWRKNATEGATNYHAVIGDARLGADLGEDHPDRQSHLLSRRPAHHAERATRNPGRYPD